MWKVDVTIQTYSKLTFQQCELFQCFVGDTKELASDEAAAWVREIRKLEYDILGVETTITNMSNGHGH